MAEFMTRNDNLHFARVLHGGGTHGTNSNAAKQFFSPESISIQPSMIALTKQPEATENKRSSFSSTFLSILLCCYLSIWMGKVSPKLALSETVSRQAQLIHGHSKSHAQMRTPPPLSLHRFHGSIQPFCNAIRAEVCVFTRSLNVHCESPRVRCYCSSQFSKTPIPCAIENGMHQTSHNPTSSASDPAARNYLAEMRR